MPYYLQPNPNNESYHITIFFLIVINEITQHCIASVSHTATHTLYSHHLYYLNPIPLFFLSIGQLIISIIASLVALESSSKLYRCCFLFNDLTRLMTRRRSYTTPTLVRPLFFVHFTGSDLRSSSF